MIGSQLFRRAAAGELALFEAAADATDDGLGTGETLNQTVANIAFAEELLLLRAAKSLTLASIGAAHRAYGDGARNEQEIIAEIADMVMDVYAMESALLRTQRLLNDRGFEATRIHADITRVFSRDAASRVEKAARAVASETEDEKCSKAIDELAHRSPMKSVQARRRIAEAVTQAGKYNL